MSHIFYCPPSPTHAWARQYRAWICCSRLCCILMPSWSSWSHCWASPTVLCSVYLLSKISASSMAAPRSSIFFSWLLIARISWCLRWWEGRGEKSSSTTPPPLKWLDTGWQGKEGSSLFLLGLYIHILEFVKSYSTMFLLVHTIGKQQGLQTTS